jgi:hypothetical protein
VIVQVLPEAIAPPVQVIVPPPAGAWMVPIEPVPVQETDGVIDASTTKFVGKFSTNGEDALILVPEELEYPFENWMLSVVGNPALIVDEARVCEIVRGLLTDSEALLD